MKYERYSSLDFANDAFFIRWIRHPDAESDCFWHTFIRENPRQHAAIEEARQLILSLDYRRERLSDGALAKVRAKLWMDFLADKETERPPKKHSGWWFAAASLALCLLTLAGYMVSKETTASRIAAATDERTTANVVRQGKNSLILLGDGSRVWLKDSSTIRYHRDFTGDITRDIFLEGEAFFEVAKDVDHPFIVHTAALKIKVVGTAFSVRSYPNDKTVETTLVRGKVHIEQSDAQGKRVGDIELKPNQKAVFDKASKVINVRQVEADTASTWKQDRLVFDEASVATVLQQLEKWYGVTIHVDSDKLDCELTATIEKESLQEVMNLLRVSHGIRYTIDGQDVFITGRFCR